MTPTLSPGATLARLKTAPEPVSTPQPMSEAAGRGTSSGILMAWLARTTTCSLNEEMLAKLWWGTPSRVNGVSRAPKVERHMVGRPASQDGQAPHCPSVERTTWSPVATLVTADPTASTTPAPSWPSTTGVGNGMVPLMTLTSLWHTPELTMRTATSLGPGSRTSSPSTTRNSSPSNTMPFMGGLRNAGGGTDGPILAPAGGTRQPGGGQAPSTSHTAPKCATTPAVTIVCHTSWYPKCPGATSGQRAPSISAPPV